MKRIVVVAGVISILFTACNDTSRSDHDSIATVTTDTAVVAVAEESRGTVRKKNNLPASDKFISLRDETSIDKLLCQGWVMDDDVDVPANNNEPEGNYPYRCFYFFDDHTYTRNVRNAMEYGTWQYNDQTKIFTVTNSENSRDVYKLAAIGPDDMIVLNQSSGSSTKLTYLADGVRYKNNSDHPFYGDNNRWRIRPQSSENDEQVRKRLKECIYFHILFYRDNLERKERIISFYGFPTCIKWYGGGIGLIKEDELPDNWYACFYNKAQALQAQKMMGAVISKKYKWSTGKVSWVKKNLEVLEQMYANL